MTAQWTKIIASFTALALPHGKGMAEFVHDDGQLQQRQHPDREQHGAQAPNRKDLVSLVVLAARWFKPR